MLAGLWSAGEEVGQAEFRGNIKGLRGPITVDHRQEPQREALRRLCVLRLVHGPYSFGFEEHRYAEPYALGVAFIKVLTMTRKLSLPNAGAHLLPEAGAQRTLEAVRCSALLAPDLPDTKRAVALLNFSFR
jgi:hypothetical protein